MPFLHILIWHNSENSSGWIFSTKKVDRAFCRKSTNDRNDRKREKEKKKKMAMLWNRACFLLIECLLWTQTIRASLPHPHPPLFPPHDCPTHVLLCVCAISVNSLSIETAKPPLHSSIPTDVMLSSTSLRISLSSLQLHPSLPSPPLISLSHSLSAHHLTWPLNRSLFSLTLWQTHSLAHSHTHAFWATIL